MLTLITSRTCDETTDRGPTGRSDSEGLGVRRVGVLVMIEPSVSDCPCTIFFGRAILVFKLSTLEGPKACRVPLYLCLYIYLLSPLLIRLRSRNAPANYFLNRCRTLSCMSADRQNRHIGPVGIQRSPSGNSDGDSGHVCRLIRPLYIPNIRECGMKNFHQR